MGECLKMLKRYDESIEAYSNAIKQVKHPSIQMTDLQHKKGLIYLEQGKYVEALYQF